MEQRKLSQEDRTFFDLVSDAAFANPFSPKRAEIDQRIIGGRKGNWKELLPETIAQVERRVAQLDGDSPVRLDDFVAPDRERMQYVFLFSIYHHYSKIFDDHILAQLQAGSQPLSIDFAGAVLGELQRRGFVRRDALRCMALFFQIRRAFHFIDRGLTGRSPCMQRLRMDLWNNIFTHDIRIYEAQLWDRMEDFSTLLLGPTGSGKGAAAAAIGQSGYIPFDDKAGRFATSFTDTFVAVNLTQFAETLLESELFGHARGAFTGAVAPHDGLFTLCGKHGSIFLDEIGDISPQIQIKLLKVLEERVFSPVGSHQTLRFQGRIIAATNQSIDRLRLLGRFRDDFYYRLCSDTIAVPSLRQRIEEDPGELNDLIDHAVRWIVGAEAPDLSEKVSQIIQNRLGPAYPWPGNVRELAQCVRSVIIKWDYQPHAMAPLDLSERLTTDILEGNLSAEILLSRYCGLLYERFGNYEEVARRTSLDRRTAKKYIQQSDMGGD
ncbi:MAG: sigma-54-dependent Fis family transcriptional regulator [Phycisphaerae bacterium]|nr:sigma-54-dependent Fis family transcriptional regulator [Phycisphaerae bacterium]